jgi:hypothetical protein
MLVMWVLALVAGVALTGCDGRMLMAGHVTSLVVAVGMFWATLNLTKIRKK